MTARKLVSLWLHIAIVIAVVALVSSCDQGKRNVKEIERGPEAPSDTQGPPIEHSDPYALLYSTSNGRSHPLPLNGAQNLSGALYIFLSSHEPIHDVTFYLNGTRSNTLSSPPYDFVGTTSNGLAMPWSTRVNSNGEHNLTAIVDTTIQLQAHFSTFHVGSPQEICSFETFGEFVHPGIMYDLTQLNFIKARVAAGIQPQMDGYQIMMSHPNMTLDYVPHPRKSVDCGTYSQPDQGCSDERDDAMISLGAALNWFITGDIRWAKKSVEIFDAWSLVIKNHTSADDHIQAAWVASSWTRAAEIIRHTTPSNTWSAEAIMRFENMLLGTYLPKLFTPSHSAGNKDFSQIEAIMAIGIFTKNRSLFNQGLNRYCSRLPSYIYLETDGPVPLQLLDKDVSWFGQAVYVDGMVEEICRDIAHCSMGYASIGNGAEIARTQGVDLYGIFEKRIVSGLRFMTPVLSNIGETTPLWFCDGARYDWSNNEAYYHTYEVLYNHYALRRNYSEELVGLGNYLRKIRPTGVHNGLQMIWETLTHGLTGNAIHKSPNEPHQSNPELPHTVPMIGSKAISAGAIAGIVLGGILLGLLGFCGILWYKKRVMRRSYVSFAQV